MGRNGTRAKGAGHILGSLVGAALSVWTAWPAPAAAQQVLICRNLHDDLANFDRRASRLGTGGARTMGTSPKAIGEIVSGIADLACSAGANAGVDAASGCRADAAPTAVGGLDPQVLNDPVRIRLVELLRTYHCDPVGTAGAGTGAGVSKEPMRVLY